MHHCEIEVAELYEEGADSRDEHDPGEDVVELAVALESEDEGGRDALDAHDGQRPGERADEHIHDNVTSLHGVAEKKEEKEGDEDAGHKHDEAGLAHVLLEDIHRQLLVR